MARSVKEEEYTGKRNAILDVAQRLIYIKGYEQMTIQDMLDDLQISKGAFYHYFDSKQAVLEALVERIGGEALQLLVPIVQDPTLPALDKFQRYLDVANRWKVGQKAFFLALMRVWFTDHNAVVRQKLRTMATQAIAPLLAEIIRQGVQEGVMRVSNPDQMGEVLASLVQDAGEALGLLLISFDPLRADMERAQRTVATYTEAFEHVLQVPAGSLTLIDDQRLQEWFSSTRENDVEMKS